MKKIFPLLLLVASAAASAQTFNYAQVTPSQMMEKNMELSLGLGVATIPRFEGSDERRTLALPVIDAQWKNGVFVSTMSGFGVNLSKDPSVQYGPRLTVELARDESRSAKLKGLGDVDTALEIGGFYNYNFNQHLALVSSVRYGSGVDHNGTQASAGLRAFKDLTPQHQVSATAGVTWASRTYLQSYFGITPAQSANSVYPPYGTASGVKDVHLAANWNWDINKQWGLLTGAAVGHLMSNAANSPLTLQRNPVSAYTALYYKY